MVAAGPAAGVDLQPRVPGTGLQPQAPTPGLKKTVPKGVRPTAQMRIRSAVQKKAGRKFILELRPARRHGFGRKRDGRVLRITLANGRSYNVTPISWRPDRIGAILNRTALDRSFAEIRGTEKVGIYDPRKRRFVGPVVSIQAAAARSRAHLRGVTMVSKRKKRGGYGQPVLTLRGSSLPSRMRAQLRFHNGHIEKVLLRPGRNRVSVSVRETGVPRYKAERYGVTVDLRIYHQDTRRGWWQKRKITWRFKDPYNRDKDGDAHEDIALGGDDCDDQDPRRFPGNPEIADRAGHDEDCNPRTFGKRDADGDGYYAAWACNRDQSGRSFCGTDCNDRDPSIHPNQSDPCNGVDDNCNGKVDEGLLNCPTSGS